MCHDDKEITINKLQEVLKVFTARSEEYERKIERLKALPENYPELGIPELIAHVEGQLKFYQDKIVQIKKVMIIVECQ